MFISEWTRPRSFAALPCRPCGVWNETPRFPSPPKIFGWAHKEKVFLVSRRIDTTLMNTLMQNLYSNAIQSSSLPRSSTASQSYIPSWCVLTQERIQCQVMEVLYSYRDCFIFSFLSLFFLFSLFFFGDKLTNECIHKQETANMHTRI